jgi:hypothetical protein
MRSPSLRIFFLFSPICSSKLRIERTYEYAVNEYFIFRDITDFVYRITCFGAVTYSKRCDMAQHEKAEFELSAFDYNSLIKSFACKIVYRFEFRPRCWFIKRVLWFYPHPLLLNVIVLLDLRGSLGFFPLPLSY